MRLIIILLFFSVNKLTAQELFVYTEPASNMAARSIGARLTNTLMKEKESGKYNYHVLPEIMWGVSKKIMIHGELFLSTRENGLKTEGAGVYMKYRFFSSDQVHSHMRLAAFVKASFNNTDIHQAAIDLNGHNSGYEGGLIATKLIKKVALSSSASIIHATDNTKQNKFPPGNDKRNAFTYSFSGGKLMLPRNYTDYKQTNVNFMTELLGQTNLQSGESYLDLAPSVQFIFLSKMRLDCGFRFPLYKHLERTADRGFLVRLEYNFFNVYK